MTRALLPEGVVVATGTVGASEVLHPAESALAAAMGPARRREFAAGRDCARRALAELGAAKGPVLRGERRMPLWPEGVVGAITHTGSFCAAAVARRSDYAGVGLDAERRDPLSERVLARICTEAERRALDTLGTHPASLWGAVVFSAKESLYKAYFPLTQHFLGFRAAEIAIDPRGSRFEARLARAEDPDAAGRRRFEGRFELREQLVLTALAIPAR